MLWFKFLSGSVKNTFFTMSKSALFSSSCFLVHVALNAVTLLTPPLSSVEWRVVLFTLAAKLANVLTGTSEQPDLRKGILK